MSEEWRRTDARDKVNISGSKQYDNEYRLLRGLICKECDSEIIYDYVENFYICLGCGL